MGQLADRDKLLADLQSKASLAEYELRIAQEDMKDLKARPDLCIALGIRFSG